MLKIVNNDIYINRGESVALTIKVWNNDGTPFIMPPVNTASIKAIAQVTEGELYEYLFYCPIINPYGVHIEVPLGTDISVFNDTQTENYTGSALVTISINKIVTTKPIRCLYIYTNTAKTQYIEFDDSNNIATCALTVKAGLYDNIVLTKVLNMHAAVSYGGETDYFPNGFSKFTTYDIYQASALSTVSTELIRLAKNGIFKLGKYQNTYYHAVLKKDGTFDIAPYEFNIVIPLHSKDTNMDAKEYVYDFAAYLGNADDAMFTSDDLVYKDVAYKRQLISPHKFVIGDSNNA